MRIVIKIGTNTLSAADGTLDTKRIKSLAGEIAALKKSSHQVVIVSSGAIGAGMGKMKLSSRPSALKDKQALAAVGQPILMDAYQEAFGALGITVAQVLVTRHDFDDRRRYVNAKNTMLSLLELGAVPVVNENDTVAVEEINFGDNDTLAAIVAAKISADWLFIFTDVDGLYKGIPGKSELVGLVEKITPEIEKFASASSGSGKGVGGMKTKVSAAKMATLSGVNVAIINGGRSGAVQKVIEGEREGTVFLSQGSMESRKCWIAFGTKCRGAIIVDEGAATALSKKSKSLLPSGIVAVRGDFGSGDMVSIEASGGGEIGRGLSSYSSRELDKIRGKKSQEIKQILGRAGCDEAVHRDNLVIWK